MIIHKFGGSDFSAAVIAVAQAAKERSVPFCIPEGQLADTVRFLHRQLGLEDGHQHDRQHAARDAESGP